MRTHCVVVEWFGGLMKKIMIIEDQLNIIELIRFNLEQQNYEVDYATDGESGLKKIREGDFDLLILDLMLPKIDGITVCKTLRAVPQFQKMPILMLTAKSTETDKVLGLEIGADDYVTKPFSVRELMARVSALLRRTEATPFSSAVLQVGDLSIDSEQFTVTKNGQLIDLTLKEFLLLKYLAEQRGKVLSRSELLDKIWGYEYLGETRTVDVHIRHLRAKLDPEETLIKTVRGIGYKII